MWFSYVYAFVSFLHILGTGFLCRCSVEYVNVRIEVNLLEQLSCCKKVTNSRQKALTGIKYFSVTIRIGHK